MSEHVMDRDTAQANIDHILERPAYRRTEWAIWCSNPIWTHIHSEAPRSLEQAAEMLTAAEAKGCHYGPSQFFLLERDVIYGEWRQP
jgi:hypothetical protein